MLEQILSLPIEKKIGQLFFIGISGGELDKISLDLLKEISPGGVCLFARNIKSAAQVRQLLSAIGDNSTIAPILSLDQEGGVVDRLRRIETPMPAASSITNSEDARKLAEITAQIIRILGFNMNFAPVVDVSDEERGKSSNGLYSRAFGTSARQVIELGGAYLETLQSNGCLGCLKHFPGLGASESDSHENLPVVNISQNEFLNNDLLPYRELLKSGGVEAVMVAHASFTNSDLQETGSDGKLLPSSLSYNFVTKLLRRQLNFNGLVITDDLEMGAILKNYGIGEACKKAISAGEDMLAICADAENIKKGYYALLDAVNNNEITESRIDESLRRIAYFKSLLSNPLEFNEVRLHILSQEISDLYTKLN